MNIILMVLIVNKGEKMNNIKAMKQDLNKLIMIEEIKHHFKNVVIDFGILNVCLIVIGTILKIIS